MISQVISHWNVLANTESDFNFFNAPRKTVELFLLRVRELDPFSMDKHVGNAYVSNM